MLTAAQCATYDESKKIWMSMTGGGDTPTTHIGASMITGLVTTTLTAPVDVIKTNMFVGEQSRLLGPCLKSSKYGQRGHCTDFYHLMISLLIIWQYS